mmetsp:Transcript_21524/g.27743  ORF Transcript_21524/g.27743 Transcript_21524/m.27743 type:complete len:149 (+) Transcript_21524:94-540(+)
MTPNFGQKKNSNFIFIAPLAILTSGFLFFKFVPLDIGIPLLLICYVASRPEKSKGKEGNVDESDEFPINGVVQDLLEEEERRDAMRAAKVLKKSRRQEAKLNQKRAAEKKANKKTLIVNGNDVENDASDDEEDINMLALRTRRGNGKK